MTVCVGTFGDDRWADLARDRAIPSAERLGVPVVHVHGETLHEARNAALARVDTEWVCHLDADDEIEHGYFEQMSKFTADVRAPSVRYVAEDRRMVRPRMPRVSGHRHHCTAACLLEGNWLVVGAVARTDLLRSVGGWLDWPVFEDWCLWLRCYRAGATFEAVQRAVYRAHVRLDSRNRAPDQELKQMTHHRILLANGLPGLPNIEHFDIVIT